MKRPASGMLIWLAVILAAVSIGFAARRLPARFAGESGLPAPTEVPPSEATGGAASIEPILALSPFGRLVASASPDAPSQETALGLTLRGVVIAARSEDSSAIVSGPSGPAEGYSIGDAITPQATLAKVASDHIVLRVDGRDETLFFPDQPGDEDGGGPPPAGDADSGVAALRALVAGAFGAGAPEPPDEAPVPSGEAPETSVLEPNAIIDGYRVRIRDNPQALLDELGLAATEAGYGVTDGASEGLLRIGLRPGDLVAKVNGQQVGNIEADRQLFEDVVASGRARIDVMRDGEGIVISFPLR